MHKKELEESQDKGQSKIKRKNSLSKEKQKPANKKHKIINNEGNEEYTEEESDKCS